MKRFLRFIFGIILLAGAILFLLSGGWRIFSLGRVRVPKPWIPTVGGSILGMREEALSNALRPLGAVTIYGQVQGNSVRLTLSWPQRSGAGLGDQALNQAQARGLIRAYQPEGLNHIDVRNQQGRQDYIGRYVVGF